MESCLVVHRAAVAIAGTKKCGGSRVGRVASSADRSNDALSIVSGRSASTDSTARSSTNDVLRAGSRGGGGEVEADPDVEGSISNWILDYMSPQMGCLGYGSRRGKLIT